MARIARVVAPGYPHHITQRGNRRQQTFFQDDDYLAYLDLMTTWCRKHKVAIWAWCLMPNHVHLIAVPRDEHGLALAIGEAHRRYTRLINFRKGWRGHLWQERFASYTMDEGHLLAAARYIEMNPVGAKMVKRPEEYRWSSARAHLAGEDDILVKSKPLLKLVDDWGKFLTLSPQEDIDLLHRHQNSGRPAGKIRFVKKIEDKLGRKLLPQKPGPKSKSR